MRSITPAGTRCSNLHLRAVAEERREPVQITVPADPPHAPAAIDNNSHSCILYRQPASCTIIKFTWELRRSPYPPSTGAWARWPRVRRTTALATTIITTRIAIFLDRHAFRHPPNPGRAALGLTDIKSGTADSARIALRRTSVLDSDADAENDAEKYARTNVSVNVKTNGRQKSATINLLKVQPARRARRAKRALQLICVCKRARTPRSMCRRCARLPCAEGRVAG